MKFRRKKTLLCSLVYSLGISFWVGTMNNRQRNHHFIQINAPDVYCLCRDCFGALLDTTVLTSVFSPPPPPHHPFNFSVKYNNTLRQNNFNSFVLLLLPARQFWIAAGFCCYIRLCIISGIISDKQEGVGKRSSKLNR